MRELRVAVVTRRFWPLVGGAETAMARLAGELRRQGARPIIVTARWERRWPREIEHGGVPVVRLPHPSLRFWGTLRYMRALANYLRRRRDEIDLVYISMLKHDAYAALGAMHGEVPVVLRAAGAGATGDFHWQRTTNFGETIRRRCLSADAFVACSRGIEAEFLQNGYPPQRVHYIPNGVVVPPPRSPERRRAARRSLGEIHPDLTLPPEAPLVVYTGRLHEGKGLLDLVQAWSALAPAHPAARLWLVGDGPQRRALGEAIADLGLADRVCLPGSFDNVEEVLDAADAFVLPSYEEGMSNALLEAMAAGLPVVVSDIPGNRSLIEHEVHGLLVPPRDPPQLAAGVRRVLEDSLAASQWGQAARRRVEAEFSLALAARRHLELFERLIRANAARRSPTTV